MVLAIGGCGTFLARRDDRRRHRIAVSQRLERGRRWRRNRPRRRHLRRRNVLRHEPDRRDDPQADPNNRAVIDNTGHSEGLHLVDAVRVTISDLIIRGASDNGLNIDDGGSYATPSNQITLRNLLVQNIGAAGGNHDGIKLSGVDQFHIDRVRILDWGDGGSAIDMVGSHQGLIENSLFQRSAPSTSGTGIQQKGGTSEIIVRANRFVQAGDRAINMGGSTGLQFFRPQPPGSVEADNLIAEGNVITGSLSRRSPG